MASNLQFLPVMQTGLKVILAVLSAFTFNVFADTAVSCPEAYEQASAKYVSEMGRLEHEAWSAGVVGGFATGGLALCAITGPAVVPCLGAVGGVALISWAKTWEGIHQLRKLESLNRLNLVYKNIKSGTAKESLEVQEFVDMLGVGEQDAQAALAELTGLMESGQFCKAGWFSDSQTASMRYEAALKKIQRRISK